MSNQYPTNIQMVIWFSANFWPISIQRSNIQTRIQYPNNGLISKQGSNIQPMSDQYPTSIQMALQFTTDLPIPTQYPNTDPISNQYPNGSQFTTNLSMSIQYPTNHLPINAQILLQPSTNFWLVSTRSSPSPLPPPFITTASQVNNQLTQHLPIFHHCLIMNANVTDAEPAPSWSVVSTRRNSILSYSIFLPPRHLHLILRSRY